MMSTIGVTLIVELRLLEPPALMAMAISSGLRIDELTV